MTFRQRVGAIAMALGGSLALTLVAGGAALAAITSTNTTNDATNVTYVYQYSAVGSWYRAYIDTDRNSATGFATAGIGANFMLENGSLYRYVGPGWNWAVVRAVTYANAANTTSWTFPRGDVAETNCTTETADVVFQVEASGGVTDTSAKLTHSYIPCTSKLVNDRTTNDATDVNYRVQATSTWTQFQVFVDSDRSATTGYGIGGLGANYLVENGTLYRHAGGGATSWNWTFVGAVTFTNSSGVLTWKVPRASMGETLTNESADLLYRVQTSTTNAALPKRTHIYFGGSGGGTPSTLAGTIVPLYTYPTDSSWSAIVTAKNGHPTVPVIAVVNPASGPGSTVDSNYTTGINKLRTAGIKVLGYVATGYAARSEALVQTEMDRWRSFYPAVDGIFFDEMSYVGGQENYYRRQDSYARSKGFTYTVGNPGTDTISSYVGVVDTIIVYESAGLKTLPTWYQGFPRERFAIIPYEVPSVDAAYIASTKQMIGFIYMTNDALIPNPWDSLPAYFPTLLGELAR